MTSQSKNITAKLESNNSSDSEELLNSYRPSVPIYIYRQLVQELEETKINLEQITVKNKTLMEKNELLQQEVIKIISCSQNLQTMLEDKSQEKHNASDSQTNQVLITTDKGKSTILFPTESPLAEVSSSVNEEEILEVEYRSLNLPDQDANDIQSFWLVVLIIFLILTCFFGSIFVANNFIKNNK